MVGMSIVGSIKSITAVMQELSDGSTNIEIGHRDRGDEIGNMAKAIDVIRRKMIEMHSIEQANHQAEQQLINERRPEMQALAAEFEK